MQRRGLFFSRLAITALVLLVFIALVRLLWYPGQYAAVAGVGKYLLILPIDPW